MTKTIVGMDMIPTLKEVNGYMERIMSGDDSVSMDSLVMNQLEIDMIEGGYDDLVFTTMSNTQVMDVDGTITELEDEVQELMDETGLI